MTITPGTFTLIAPDGEAGKLADLSAALPFPAYDELRRYLFARLYERQDDVTLQMPHDASIRMWLDDVAEKNVGRLVFPATLNGCEGALIISCERSEATRSVTYRISTHT